MNRVPRSVSFISSPVSRRGFLIGAAGLAVAPVFGQSQALQGVTAYIAPDGQGDGSSPENAASLSSLGQLVGSVGPGGTVGILADRGSYDNQPTVEIANGGTTDAPVHIMGIDGRGRSRRAVIRGSRQSWRKPENERGTTNVADFGGGTTFAFGRGSSHLHFSALSFVNTGRIFDFSDRRESGLLIEDVDFLNVRDGFYTNEGSALSTVVLRRFSGVGFSKKAVRVHGASRGWLIESCELDSGWQSGDNFAVGIEMNHDAHDITISGGFTINCLDTQGGDQEKYWNADGVASEEGNYNIRILDHRSAGHSDGGYDLKSEATTLTRCISEDNKRNYRIWGGIGAEPILMENCHSRTPRSRGGTGSAAHLWMFGSEGGSNASSVIFRGGSMDDRRPGSPAVYVDGDNVAVHLIDADLSGLGQREALVEGEGEGTSLVVGSAADPELSRIAVSDPINALEGLSKVVPLQADGPASWRILDVQGIESITLEADRLILGAAPAGITATFTIQARGSNGVAMQQRVHAEILPNVYGAGTALAIAFTGRDGAQNVQDKTGINSVKFFGDAQIVNNALIFGKGDDYVTVGDSDNFYFDGPFTIDTEFMLHKPAEESGQDVFSHWGDASRQRGFTIRCEENGRLVFVWTYDGSDVDMPLIEGPKLEAKRYYKVRVDRDEPGTMRLYVDGAMVGRKADSGGPIRNSATPLRISGRADGKYAASGKMRSLTVTKGYALTASDLGYAV